MKLSAIAGRGAAKDFWDLDGLLEHGVAGGSLSAALELYTQKFPIEDVGHVVRSLAYFGDADAAPFPNGLSGSEWSRLKDGFRRRLKKPFRKIGAMRLRLTRGPPIRHREPNSARTDRRAPATVAAGTAVNRRSPLSQMAEKSSTD